MEILNNWFKRSIHCSNTFIFRMKLITWMIYLFIIFLSIASYASEDTIIYLKKNVNFSYPVEYIEILESSTAVQIQKKPNELIFKNLMLSSVTDSIVTIIQSNGNIITLTLKDDNQYFNNTSLSNNVHHSNNYWRFINETNFRNSTDTMPNYKNSQDYFQIFDTLSFKLNDFKAKIVYDNDIKDKESITKKNKISDLELDYKYAKYEYKDIGTIHSKYQGYGVSNYNFYNYDDNSVSLHAQNGVLNNKYKLDNYYMGYTFPNLNSVYGETATNHDLGINYYNAGTKFNYGAFNFNFQDSMLVMDDKRYYEGSSVHILRSNIHYTINKDIGNFKLNYIDYNNETAVNDMVNLNRTVTPSHNQTLLSASSSVDNFSFLNKIYNIQNAYYTYRIYNNSIEYDSKDDWSYLLKSNYAINNTYTRHTIENMFIKKWYNFQYTGSIQFDVDNIYTNALKYTNKNLELGMSYQYDSKKTYDSAHFNLNYLQPKYQYLIDISYDNPFVGESKMYSITNQIKTTSLIKNVDFNIYNTYSYYEDIQRKNYTTGINFKFGYEKEISSNALKLTKTKKMIFCLDENYNGQCEPNEKIMSNFDVNINDGESFTTKKTDMNGVLAFDYLDEHKNDIDISFNDKKYVYTSLSDTYIPIQSLKEISIKLIDNLKNDLNEINGNIVCLNSNYNSKLILNGLTSVRIPTEGNCKLNIQVIDNTVPLEQNYSFNLEKDFNEFKFNPLKRASFTFFYDKNNNGELDEGEIIKIKIKNKELAENYIIDDFSSKKLIILDKKYACNVPNLTSFEKYFDKNFIVKCRKK